MLTLRSFGGNKVTSLLPINTCPELGDSNPAIIRSVVVLPHPEGPRSVTRVPASIVKSIASTAAACVHPKSHISRNHT